MILNCRPRVYPSTKDTAGGDPSHANSRTLLHRLPGLVFKQ